MSVTIREGSIEELVSVNQQIAEFQTPYEADVFEQRLAGKAWLGLVAEEAGQLLGFKLGYQESATCFYSWLGGIIPEGRRQGIARSLLYQQESWVRQQGYAQIHVKSRNRYRGMLQLLLREGYDIVALESHQPPGDSRIHFLKSL